MNKIYNFNTSLSNVYVIGDLHGSFELLKYNIKKHAINDSVIIVAGDSGFGFEKFEYYVNQYNKQKNVLEEYNVTVIFIRGNHDDKSYYDNEKVSLKFWKTIPDYSVLKFTDGNVLCIGGAISIDRLERIEKENTKKYLGKKFYFPDENVFYNQQLLDNLKRENISIDCLITHTIMSFCPPHTKSGVEKEIQSDVNLENDLNVERNILDNIYNHLIRDKHPLKYIFHGHFHSYNVTYIDDIKIVSLDCVNPKTSYWNIVRIKY